MRHAFISLALISMGCGLTDDVPEAPERPIRLNEILASGAESADWIELYNLSDAPVALEGWALNDGDEDWVLPSSAALAPHGFLVLLCDGEGGATAPFKLSSSGERVLLKDPQGLVIDEIEFGPQDTDRSLARGVDGTGAWVTGAPTPGASNAPTGEEGPDGGAPPPVEPGVVINEVMSDNQTGIIPPGAEAPSDWIELYNKGEEAVDLSGWSLSAASGEAILPPMTRIPGQQRVLLFADGYGIGMRLGITLEAGFLTLSDTSGAQADQVQIPELEPDQSFGRTPDGGQGQGILSSPSPGAPNL